MFVQLFIHLKVNIETTKPEKDRKPLISLKAVPTEIPYSFRMMMHLRNASILLFHSTCRLCSSFQHKIMLSESAKKANIFRRCRSILHVFWSTVSIKESRMMFWYNLLYIDLISFRWFFMQQCWWFVFCAGCVTGRLDAWECCDWL